MRLKAGFMLRVNFLDQNSIEFRHRSLARLFTLPFFFSPSAYSCTFIPLLLPLWSVSPPVSVCGPDSGGTSVGFPARDHGSLVGLMEQRREYQLKGYKYLRAEIFNNIRVGGPGDSSTHKMKVVAR